MTGTLRGVSNKHCLLSFFFHLLLYSYANKMTALTRPDAKQESNCSKDR